MRTEPSRGVVIALALAVLAVGAGSAEADDAVGPASSRPTVAWSPARFTLGLPVEVTLVGLTYGVRPEVLYRFGGVGTVSRLRLAVGVLDGPDQLFVPLSLGYRAVFRQAHRVRPEVGAGLELQHRLVSDFDAVRQYGVYVEGGLGSPSIAAGRWARWSRST